jgi:hypothetical protein
LNSVQACAGIVLHLLDGGESAPDDRADLSTVSAVPDPTIQGGIRRRGDDLDEVFPGTDLPVKLAGAFLMVGFPCARANVAVIAIVPVGLTIAVTVGVRQPLVRLLHAQLDVFPGLAPGGYVVGVAVGAIEHVDLVVVAPLIKACGNDVAVRG